MNAPVTSGTASAGIGDFIARWRESGTAERANYALFLVELCGVLGLPSPDPTAADPERDAYVFERAVDFRNPDGTISKGFIDLYRRDAFVLETKQGCAAKTAPSLLVEAGLRGGSRSSRGAWSVPATIPSASRPSSCAAFSRCSPRMSGCCGGAPSAISSPG